MDHSRSVLAEEASKAHPEALSSKPDSFYKLKAGLFLASVAGIGFFAGFGSSLASVKKKGIPMLFLETAGLTF